MITLGVLFLIRGVLDILALLCFHITFGTAFCYFCCFVVYFFILFFNYCENLHLEFWEKFHQYCKLLLAESCFHNINKKKIHNINKAVSNVIWKHRGPRISTSLESLAIFLYSCIFFKFFSVLKLSFCKSFISSVTCIKIVSCKRWYWLHLRYVKMVQ